MWDEAKIRRAIVGVLVGLIMVIFVLMFTLLITQIAEAWDEKNSRYGGHDNWQSGTIDARIGAPISAEDYDNPAYLLDYTEERERIRQEEILEELRNDDTR